jgi:hypothetical protein
MRSSYGVAEPASANSTVRVHSRANRSTLRVGQAAGGTVAGFDGFLLVLQRGVASRVSASFRVTSRAPQIGQTGSRELVSPPTANVSSLAHR